MDNGGTHTTTGVRFVGVPICPDLLQYEDIGAADTFRGRVVRLFFFVLDKVGRV